MPPLVRVRDLHKQYPGEATPVDALKDASLDINAGEFIALMGPSGCGKSTLLHIVGAMDRPTQGEVWLRDHPLHTYDEERLTQVRRTQIGFVFQFFYLLPTFTVEENVALPLLLAGNRNGRANVTALLERVGVAHRARSFPHQLSGGEMQRVAIARAVVHKPCLIVADEPTGNLDSENGAQVLDLLNHLRSDGTTAVLMATHSEIAAASANRVLHMKDGRLT